MRIALITTSFLPKIGGAEFVVHHLAQQWCRQGHEVCVINGTSAEATQPDARYSVRKYSSLRGTSRFGYHRFPFSWYATRQVRRALEEYRPEFISAHFGYPMAIWLSRLRPVPRFLITCHGPALNTTPQGPRQRYGIDALLAEAMNQSAGAVAISTHAREVMERIGVEPSRILDIPNGVDLDRFQRTVESFNLRARFGIPGDAIVILSVGRESWAKAYDTGIRAFAKVAARVGQAYYVILGRGTSKWGPLARELGVEQQVVFCDGVYGDELVGAYQQADIFFLPSAKELCPLVVPEAMGAGLPQVVTNVSGSQDMIRTGHNGIVVEPGRDDEMAKALGRLIMDRSLRTRLAAGSRAESAKYGWDRISRLYLKHGLDSTGSGRPSETPTPVEGAGLAR